MPDSNLQLTLDKEILRDSLEQLQDLDSFKYLLSQVQARLSRDQRSLGQETQPHLLFRLQGSIKAYSDVLGILPQLVQGLSGDDV